MATKAPFQGPRGFPGLRGEPGLVWLDGWTAGALIQPHMAVLHNGSSYRAVLTHTASLALEPGVGEAWESAWVPVALKGLKGDPGEPGEAGSASWGEITDKPTTLAGYGITDADFSAPIESLIDKTTQTDLRVAAVKTQADAAEAEIVVVQAALGSLDDRADAAAAAIAAVGNEVAAGRRLNLLAVDRLITTDVNPLTTFVVGAPVDGDTASAGKRYVKAFSNGGVGVPSNGIFEVQPTGPAIRALDADSSAELLYGRFQVAGGSHADEIWSIRNTSPITPETTPIVIKLEVKAESTQGEVNDGRQGRSNLGQAMADALEGRVPDTTTPDGMPLFWAAGTSSDALLAGYDAAQRDIVFPGADRPSADMPWGIVIGFGQSNIVNRNAWPPISPMVRNRYSSWMPAELGCCGPGMTDITAVDLDNISPAHARMDLPDNSTEGETDWHALCAQLLEAERAAKLASRKRIFINVGVGGRSIAELSASLYGSFAAAEADFEPRYAGQLLSVENDDGSHFDPILEMEVSNTGTFEWTGTVLTRKNSEILYAFDNIPRAVRHYFRLFQGNVIVEFVDVDHGESDEDKTKVYYRTAFEVTYDKVEAVLKVINPNFCIFGYNRDGSDRRPLFLCSQPPVRNTQALAGDAYTWGAQDAMLELDAVSRLGSDQRQIVLAGPTYAYAHCDTSHRGPVGVSMVGAWKGYARSRWKATGRTGAFRFLPTATVRDGKIILQSDPPTPLKIKAGGAYPEWPSKGFVLRNGIATVAIASVAVDTLDPTCIAVTPQSAAPAGTVVHYASICTWLYDPGPGAGGNVAEDIEVPVAMLPGKTMTNWALSCRSVLQ